MLFAIVDGDDVGNKIESHLLANDVAGFVQTSKRISLAMETVAGSASRVPGVAVISTGGDSILLQLSEDSITRLSDALEVLQQPGQFTFSVGVGRTLRESFIALRMAKSSGKCRVSIYPER
ncbi:mCpol domain-containing protein [Streptomyces sp. RK31]|uniref:mCpol domain-containing protein n=1 Tax=Streptomyces sp. RK31 TaxID=2824892 RepID=UPI001B38C198|nr:mCpol domain-containing protein [Streptomyces sp. RK31]MBQ0972294.1 mCpol domain-containing protein [Streptomyces sp. RK31]